MRLNYTTYDVRRGQDIINPNTDHCDVMLLSLDGDDSLPSTHQYQYVQILGIYYVNIIYAGAPDHVHCMYFLWVRWFENIKALPVQDGWSTCQLDQLCFPSLDKEGAFGFLDPAQVLHACHLIQRFHLGKCSPDGKGISECVQDHKNWLAYYVNW